MVRKLSWPTLGVAGCLVFALLGGQVSAQVVQLPTFSNFTYRGSVMVPDGGTLSVGGIKSVREGSIERGVPGLSNVPGVNRLFKNRAIGRETSNSQMTITPQVLIMSELEEDHLAAAGYGTDLGAGIGLNEEAGLTDAQILAKAAFLSKHVGRNQPVAPATRR